MASKSKILKGHIESMSKVLDEYRKRPATYSVFVLYGPPLAGKTTVARKIAEQLGGTYIDFLSECLPTLNPRLGLYEPSDFKGDVNEYSKKSTALLVVDEIEALLDTWTREQQENLFRMLSRWRAHSLLLITTRVDLPFEDFLGNNKVFRIGGDRNGS